MIGANKSLLKFAWVTFLGITLAGCGGDGSPPRAAVQGTVTLDGQPLEEGLIRFVPIEGTPGQKLSVAIEAGSFEAEAKNGPAAGKHRVEIESTDSGGLEMDDEDAIDRLESEGKKRVKVTKVPSYYNKTSDLSETLSADEPNVLTFELSSKRKR